MKHIVHSFGQEFNKSIEVNVGAESTLITMTDKYNSISIEFSDKQTSELARFIKFANKEAKITKND